MSVKVFSDKQQRYTLANWGSWRIYSRYWVAYKISEMGRELDLRKERTKKAEQNPGPQKCMSSKNTWRAQVTRTLQATTSSAILTPRQDWHCPLAWPFLMHLHCINRSSCKVQSGSVYWLVAPNLSEEEAGKMSSIIFQVLLSRQAPSQQDSEDRKLTEGKF